MTSDEDFYPLKETSSKSRRRSKRITKSSIRKATVTNLKKSIEKAGKEYISKSSSKNLPKAASEDLKNATDKVFEGFSCEPLHPAELEQLWRKFERDGHFRCVPSSALSPGPKARRKNGKLGAKMAKHSAKVSASLTSQTASLENDTDQEPSPAASDPSSVTLLNPLPNATGSTVRISPDKSSYIPLLATEEYRSWNKPVIRQNFLSSGTFRETNEMDLCSNGNASSNIFPQKQFQSLSMPKPRVQTDHSGLRHPYVTSGQMNRANRENFVNSYDPYPKLPSTAMYRHNICNSSSQTATAVGSCQGRQIKSMGPSASVLRNEIPYGNLPSKWLGCPAANNVSSTITNVPSNDVKNSLNTPNCFASNFRAYNTELRNVNNFGSPGGFGENENCLIGHNSVQNGHCALQMPWAGLQVFPKFCPTGNELPYSEDLNNFPVPSGQPVPSMLINGQKNIANQPTYWMQNDPFHRAAFAGNEVTSSEITNSTNTVSATMTTSLNEATEVASVNGNETDDSTLFIDDISGNVDIRHIVSSFSSYDDDIDYQNYVDDNFPYNENSVSTTTTLDHESNPALSTSIKNEVRSLYDTSNFSQYNYSSNFDNEPSIFHDLETKKELENPPNGMFSRDSTSA